MKKLIFSLLPEGYQRRIIMRKTGVKKITANIDPKYAFDLNIKPNSKLWEKRLKDHYGHEPHITRFFENTLKENDICYEVGAHFGYFTSLISSVQSNTKVFAFEANWFSFHYLNMNREINDKQNNWTIKNVFVGQKTERKNGENFISINDFINKGNPIPTIFQMDVDGEEFNIIKGANKLLGNGITEFLIESHPKDLKERNLSIHQFLELFDSKQYKFKYLPNLRDEDTRWIENLDDLNLSEEFYLYAYPKNIIPRIKN